MKENQCVKVEKISEPMTSIKPGILVGTHHSLIEQNRQIQLHLHPPQHHTLVESARSECAKNSATVRSPNLAAPLL